MFEHYIFLCSTTPCAISLLSPQVSYHSDCSSVCAALSGDGDHLHHRGADTVGW